MMFGDITQTVFFVEDDDQLRLATAQALELAGLPVRAFAEAGEALVALGRDFAGVIISDIRMPHIDGLELLARVRALDADIPVVLVTGHGDVAMAVAALHDGAFDFLTKPFATDRLVAAVRRALDRRALVIENRQLRAAAAAADAGESPLIGDSAAMVRLRDTIRQLAEIDLDVLVEGETGTGKELVARLLHRQGPRRARPFVAVNCGALPEGLAEVELFGHAADSVAHTRLARTGRIAASSGGTLLLDEVDSMPLAMQAKLLRVIEEREVQQIGADHPEHIDLRVVATAKGDLAAAVAEGRFRADLYYRLSTLRVRIPPLRERGGDILLLFAAFLEQARKQLGRPGFDLTDRVRTRIQAHDWPGNVRELRNFAFEALIDPGAAIAAPPAGEAVPLPARLAAFEAELIRDALARAGGSVAGALEELQIPRKTFYDKVARLGIDLTRYREVRRVRSGD